VDGAGEVSDEQALLEAIRAAPDDDAPRLVYADLLTSRGDPRGEFIALQCRLAASPDDEARRKLRIAENALLKAHGQQWAASLVAVTPPRTAFGVGFQVPVKYEFRRGFIETMTLPLEALEVLEPLFEAAPLLRALRFDATAFVLDPENLPAPPSLSGRLTSPLLARLRELELRLPGAGNAAALELAACTHLENLEVLTLHLTSLGDFTLFSGAPETHVLTAVGARALAGSPHLAKLRRLDLAQNWLDAEAVKAVVSSAWQLEHLDLANNPIDDAAVMALARAPQLSRLEHLGLAFATLTATGLDALARSKTLTALRSLDLEGCALGGTVLARFLERLALPSLTTLRLERTGLGDAGALALAQAPVSRQFTSLSLGHNRITRKGIEALAGSESLRGLERLLLNDPYQGKKDTLALLTASPTLANCRIWVKGRLLARPKPPKPASTRKKKAPP
jgi:uncharacterized protein (TIGR02996 family)